MVWADEPLKYPLTMLEQSGWLEGSSSPEQNRTSLPDGSAQTVSEILLR
jgi:hypothetical protein